MTENNRSRLIEFPVFSVSPLPEAGREVLFLLSELGRVELKAL